MLEQQRTINSSGKEVEDPCAELETPPPSHLFSSTLYEPKNIFAFSQRLTPVSPSFTVFSVPAQDHRELLSSPIPEEVLPTSLPVHQPQSHSRQFAWSELHVARNPQQSAAEDRSHLENQTMTRSIKASPQLAWGESVDSQILREQRRTASLPPVLQQSQSDLSAFLTSPVPKNFQMQCCIRRNRSGLKRFFPSYFLHTSDGHRFLLAAKKRVGNKTANYLITTNENELSVKTPGYLGKLRSNFLGTEFNIYGKGANPSNKKATPATLRENLGVVMFYVTELGEKRPRKMRVAIPALDERGRRVVWKPAQVLSTQKEETLASHFKQGHFQGMLTFFNKPPIWDESARAFVLNFKGRSEKNSRKNFQLIDNTDEKHIYLQLGKVERDLFTLDFLWPFSPLQAFALALSSIDKKIALS